MNPKAPYVYGMKKLHKQHKPVRSIFNWKDSPGYKLAKYIATQLLHELQFILV